jgi:hypothetical protein
MHKYSLFAYTFARIIFTGCTCSQALAPDLPAKDGSVAALWAYAAMGITCFDLDLVLMADNQILVRVCVRLHHASSQARYKSVTKVSHGASDRL